MLAPPLRGRAHVRFQRGGDGALPRAFGRPQRAASAQRRGRGRGAAGGRSRGDGAQPRAAAEQKIDAGLRVRRLHCKECELAR